MHASQTSAAYLARAELRLGDVSNDLHVDQRPHQVALLRVQHARLEPEEVAHVHLCKGDRVLKT
jgi:hypothetical protein